MTRIDEGRGIVERIELDGLEISIEVEAGGTRSGTNYKGERWENKVHSAYGYILGTNSPDGEHLDVWVKKNAKPGKRVYVVHQLSPDGSKYDEDKVMLGFSSAEQAITAFKREVFKPQMFGGMSEFDIEHFKVIAYSASNSTVMLASQRMYDKFQEKGLLPKGIKSPIQIAQIVKEGADMLHIAYERTLIAESAFDLATRAGLNVLKSNNDLMFVTENDLSEFIRLIDESQEDLAHLGDLYENLPESFDEIVESIADEDSGEATEVEESIDTYELQRLAGVHSVVVESTGTPSVHAVRQNVSALTESHNTALRLFMIGYARAKQATLMESITDLDMDAALRRFANTILMHPQANLDKIISAVAEATTRGDQRALVEHVGSTTGLSVDAFRDVIVQRKWDNNRISRQVFESLMESTEANWNLNCPDKGSAFAKACR